jgi:hypothetical protein
VAHWCLLTLQVLSNSYVFAYFFFGGDLFTGEFTEQQNAMNQDLFEHNQAQLAMEVSAETAHAPGGSSGSKLSCILHCHIVLGLPFARSPFFNTR